MLYFDESGYTGSDLRNSEQPYFTLASVRLTDDEVDSIKDSIAYAEWGGELHFTRMYSSHRGREMLRRIFGHPLMNSDHVLLSCAEKRYCIYANIVNILVETFCYNKDVNLYEGARHLILASGLYYSAFLHQDKDLVSDFETSFVKMVRDPSTSSIQRFYRLVDKLMKNEYTAPFFSLLLSKIPPTLEYIEEALDNNKFYMDLTVPMFFMMIQEWYNKTHIKEDVLFDSSKPFSESKSLLENLKDMSIPETEVGYGMSKHVYPLPVGEMRIVESYTEFGIQLADVYASALNFILTKREKYIEFQEELRKLPIFQSVSSNLMPPTVDSLKARMEDFAGVDPVEFLCDYWESTN